MTSASNPVTASNKKTITLSEETLTEIGCALQTIHAEFQVAIEKSKSLGLSAEYFEVRLIKAEQAITEFYAARNGA